MMNFYLWTCAVINQKEPIYDFIRMPGLIKS